MKSTSAASKFPPAACRSIPAEISLLSTATRVGGPAFTWIRDTRDLAMDARRGTNTSFQEFLSDRFFGAEAEFNRIDYIELQLLQLW